MAREKTKEEIAEIVQHHISEIRQECGLDSVQFFGTMDRGSDTVSVDFGIGSAYARYGQAKCFVLDFEKDPMAWVGDDEDEEED